MSTKSFFAKILAKLIAKQTNYWAYRPAPTQEKVFRQLIKQAKNTAFGKDHNFQNIKSYQDFNQAVPVRDYEDLKPYIERILHGEKNVLWKGKPIYLAKTSGTTSGVKYIPLTKASMPTHIDATRNALLSYINETGNTQFIDGKMIFLQGSPILEDKNGIKFGRLSGIAAHYVPAYLQRNRLPSYQTNCIEDWETKVDKIVEETINQKMTLISGIPSWVQMYFEKITQKAGKPVGEVFQNFNLFVYGGVNFEPYRAKFNQLIGRNVDSIELYPASEGFFAYQDSQEHRGMLLLLNSGIFYQFIKAEEFYQPNPKRYTISEVKLGVNYVMIISTNAGLWAYNIGDTVEFVSKTPYRIIVTGRIKHFISAFGEHVIGKEIENALQAALQQSDAIVTEFTVAPQISPSSGLPYHQWYIEFEKAPSNLDAFAQIIDQQMCIQNTYYNDLITGNVLRTLQITQVPQHGFESYMKSIGKLGGQNKLPRLSNDRAIADQLDQIINGK